ncbi:hypothetical protein [Calidifontibacter terrae]
MLPDTDRLAARLRVLLSLFLPTLALIAISSSTQALAGGAALVVLAAAIAVVEGVRRALPPRSAPPRARAAQTATFAPVCRSIALPQDPIRPRAPGLV